MTFKVKAKREKRIPKHFTDPNSIKIIKCRYCKDPITFSYGSVGRDGRVFACNPDGTKHVDKSKGGRKR